MAAHTSKLRVNCTLCDLSRRWGGKLLFTDINVATHPGYKVGVVGCNGVGKSSLVALLRCEMQADSGVVELPRGWTTTQETPAVERSALELAEQLGSVTG